MKQNYKVKKEDYLFQVKLLKTLTRFKMLKSVTASMTNSTIPVYVLGNYEVVEHIDRVIYLINIEPQCR